MCGGCSPTTIEGGGTIITDKVIRNQGVPVVLVRKNAVNLDGYDDAVIQETTETIIAYLSSKTKRENIRGEGFFEGEEFTASVLHDLDVRVDRSGGNDLVKIAVPGTGRVIDYEFLDDFNEEVAGEPPLYWVVADEQGMGNGMVVDDTTTNPPIPLPPNILKLLRGVDTGDNYIVINNKLGWKAAALQFSVSYESGPVTDSPSLWLYALDNNGGYLFSLFVTLFGAGDLRLWGMGINYPLDHNLFNSVRIVCDFEEQVFDVFVLGGSWVKVNSTPISFIDVGGRWLETLYFMNLALGTNFDPITWGIDNIQAYGQYDAQTVYPYKVVAVDQGKHPLAGQEKQLLHLQKLPGRDDEGVLGVARFGGWPS